MNITDHWSNKISLVTHIFVFASPTLQKEEISFQSHRYDEIYRQIDAENKPSMLTHWSAQLLGILVLGATAKNVSNNLSKQALWVSDNRAITFDWW